MCVPVAAAAVIGSAILGAGVSMYQGSKSRKQANTAQAANERQAAQAAQRSEQQFNRMNQKQPAIAALWDRNKRGASRGLGSTFLTGTTGVPNMTSFLGGSPSVVGA